MTRRWLSLPALAALLALPASAPAQIDIDALRNGVLGCPELAADPDVGTLAAFLCRPEDWTALDAPINQTGDLLLEVRAGSFDPYVRPSLTAAARPTIGDAEYFRLQNLLLDAQVLSRSLDAYRLALLAEGDAAGAAAILGTPESVFDANVAALLATRPDRNRFADLRSGLLHSPGARDTVSQHEQAFGETISATIGELPVAYDAEGLPIFTAQSAGNRAIPVFLGPDGERDTVDDLPFVSENEHAQAAGYALGAPIQGTLLASFDGTFRAGPSGSPIRPIYSLTAQITVASASEPGAMKLVELYGVYSAAYLINRGCSLGFGSYDPATGACLQGGVNVSDEALERGCGVIVAQQGLELSVGRNADGSCIEVNTRSPSSGSQLQFEVIALLGDLNARPAEATVEPVDLTDLHMLSAGGEYNTLPARPRADGTGNVAFPVATPEFGRSVDLATGAPLAPGGAECSIRRNELGEALGPNGIPGDGDDAFPSAGYCLLWNVPDGEGLHLLRTPAQVASNHSANQSLFHTLCTLSFDSDLGRCALDDLNNPTDFGTRAAAISGVGTIASVLLGGVETIQPVNPDGSTSVVQRGSNAVLSRLVLPLEPLAIQDLFYQDLGLSLQPAQAALLGCGAGHASPCSGRQLGAWDADPAIVAALTREAALGPTQGGGIDLMSTDASVLVQEFAVVKHRKTGALVGTATNDSGQIVYLPGVGFSRDGQQSMDADANFTRQGIQTPPPAPGVLSPENGAYLGLTPTDAIDLGSAGRAQYQLQAGNLREADAWIEPMPWKVDQALLDSFGAIVFNSDPNNPLDLDSPLNDWNLIDGNGSRDYSNVDGEYCARWMVPVEANVATPFNLGCTALETISANLERLHIGTEVIGQDRVFDPPESLAELVAMLDGDLTNDATGDPIAGPDGIFARNQYVISDDEMDFEVVTAALIPDSTFVPVAGGGDPKLAAAELLDAYDPETSCATAWCYLDVDNVLIDPDDARPEGGRTLILAMPIGASIDIVTPVDPSDPSTDFTPTGSTRKLNLARLQFFDLPTLRRLLASRVIAIDVTGGTEYVRMSLAQRNDLIGQQGDVGLRGRDMDGDFVSDLDRNRDAIWDGQDDYLPGPISDDSIACGSGVRGDLLQDGVQYSPYRADEKPGSESFAAVFPDGLPPRSPVFCSFSTALLGLIGPTSGALPGQSDAFLWHGGMGAPGSDDDADGFPDVVDNCATIANASQADADADGVGDDCDNCAAFPNGRVAEDYLSENPWATLTGGQRDDDRDGFGNVCDAKFPGVRGTNVSLGDAMHFYRALGRDRSADDCAVNGTRSCAIFDLDPSGDSIDDADSRRFGELLGRRPGPRCAACPLACESGEAENCD